jgi:hypothetical protein
MSYAESSNSDGEGAKNGTKVHKIYVENVMSKILWFGRERVGAGQGGFCVCIGLGVS